MPLDLELALTFALKSDVALLRRSGSTTRPEYREQNSRCEQIGLFSPHPNHNTGAFRIGIFESTDNATRSSDSQLVQLTARLALSLFVCVDSGCRCCEQRQSRDLSGYKGLPFYELFGPIRPATKI